MDSIIIRTVADFWNNPNLEINPQWPIPRQIRALVAAKGRRKGLSLEECHRKAALVVEAHAMSATQKYSASRLKEVRSPGVELPQKKRDSLKAELQAERKLRRLYAPSHTPFAGTHIKPRRSNADAADHHDN